MIKVTCAIIIDIDKVLVTQNSEHSDHPFQWEFPGGKIKEGETEKQCIVREINEELGVEIEIIKKLNAIEHDYGSKQICLIPFLCKITMGSIVLTDHVAEKWIGTSELNSIDFSEADKVLIHLQENRLMLEKYIGKQVDKT